MRCRRLLMCQCCGKNPKAKWMIWCTDCIARKNGWPPYDDDEGELEWTFASAAS